jgi:hypothetical protein
MYNTGRMVKTTVPSLTLELLEWQKLQAGISMVSPLLQLLGPLLSASF